MDPDFVIELRAYLKGQADHADLVKRRKEHEQRRKGINARNGN